MPRPFPILAALAVLLLVAGFASGWLAPGGTHARVGLSAAGATLAMAGAGLAHFRAAEARVEGRARAAGLPEWVGALAEKNRRKASAYLGWGVVLVGLAAGSGWLGVGPGHRMLSAMAVGFQAGAVAGLLVVGVAQSRLSRDVAGWSGAGRPGRPPGGP